jgi:hypothetical protein
MKLHGMSFRFDANRGTAQNVSLGEFYEEDLDACDGVSVDG